MPRREIADDAVAEARATRYAVAGGVAPFEGPEQPFAIGRRDVWPGIGDRHDHVAVHLSRRCRRSRCAPCSSPRARRQKPAPRSAPRRWARAGPSRRPRQCGSDSGEKRPDAHQLVARGGIACVGEDLADHRLHTLDVLGHACALGFGRRFGTQQQPGERRTQVVRELPLGRLKLTSLLIAGCPLPRPDHRKAAGQLAGEIDLALRHLLPQRLRERPPFYRCARDGSVL